MNMSCKIEDIITEAACKLKNAGVSAPRLEARLLLAEAIKCDASELLFMHGDISQDEKTLFEGFIKRRLAGEPVCKILGHKDFYKYSFLVNNKVLSPRPDTEILVEAASAFAKMQEAPEILDLGTGSGCIILSLLADLPKAHGTAVDISHEALDICKKNAEALGVSERCDFVEGSWFDSGLHEQLKRTFDIIVTNPPYIPTEEIFTLQKEVRDFDPLRALDGGADGFEHYRKLAEVVPGLLKAGGRIFIEGGAGQAEQIAGLFEKSGLMLIDILADLQGINRCVIIKK